MLEVGAGVPVLSRMIRKSLKIRNLSRDLREVWGKSAMWMSSGRVVQAEGTAKGDH